MPDIELVRHQAYFFCGYCVGAEHVPLIETYVYLGTASEVLGGPAGEKVEHMFQDAECYYQQQRGELSANASPEDRGMVLVANDLIDPMVQDYDGLLAFIAECKKDARQ